ncbi:MAG: SMP-30/gluconolactonase/LRE family protein, partial [Actinobacteria bacterium]|nr:SMP-30/gluconolactonase/LRE family protein [Actinomycetota bacterium]
LDDLGELWPETDVRLNDGGCDPQGGFLCGSMGTDYAPGRGTLYRLAPDRTITPVLPGLGVPNGLEWTPDGGTAYFVDSLAGTVEVFAHDPERGLHDRRPFVHVPSDEGLPDGLTVDAEGYVWIAIWGGGQVRRYAPDGRLDEVLEFPVRRVTACTFGGPGLDELYVTSVGDHALEHEGDVAGALFRVRVGVTGQPVRPFAG